MRAETGERGCLIGTIATEAGKDKATLMQGESRT